jgi:hypothetical protein
LVLEIYNNTNKSILVLGRNNKDVNLILGENFKLNNDGKIICLKNPNINIYFLTVHKSKGLEEENVIIINLENNFNKKQNSKFIDSYLEKVVKLIEKTLNTKFNLNNEEHRYLLEKYLDYYNKVFNNRPLDRLPINSFEVGRGYKRYVRPRNKRLSTSFIKKENIISHLDRKVGLVIEITSPDAIKTTSIGYTSESDYEIFEEDSVSLADLIYQTDEDGVNETCLDITKCAVKYVILVGNDPKNIKRAEDLAESYGVEIKSFESNKSLK